jgi:hypothetical protein
MPRAKALAWSTIPRMRVPRTVEANLRSALVSLAAFVAITAACASRPLDEGHVAITVDTSRAIANTPEAFEAYAADASRVVSLHLATIDPGTIAGRSTVDATASDPSAVQAAYRATLALPPWDPTGPINCPVDIGLTYALTFRASDGVVLDGQLRGSGCIGLAISGADGALSLYAGSPDYWALLESTLALPPHTLR